MRAPVLRVCLEERNGLRLSYYAPSAPAVNDTVSVLLADNTVAIFRVASRMWIVNQSKVEHLPLCADLAEVSVKIERVFM